MEDPYIAHFFVKEDLKKQTQSVSEHVLNTAALACANAPLSRLTAIAWLCGVLHDAGKYSDEFREYMERAMADRESVRRGEVNHSTAGGFLLEKLCPRSNLAVMGEMAIFCHHGLRDSFSTEKGSVYIQKRLSDPVGAAEERYYRYIDKEDIKEKIGQAREDLLQIMKEITDFIRQKNVRKDLYGNRDFYLGMYERVILSLLIDADRTDTACFMEQRKLPVVKSDEEVLTVWKNAASALEKYLKKLQRASKLKQYRNEISEKCMEAGERPERLYRLTLPTGAGKTLSSLRFALRHAMKYHKRHIIYVAPYQSIIDQNAEEIRKATGDSRIVLEHHCNVIQEGAQARKQYELLTENWDAPIIVTTAVQFLNTLFASGGSNVRRMYSILNSVIIFDEVQTLPVKLIKLFNLAVNFLTAFGNSTVVLCSATQPLLDELNDNVLLSPANMAETERDYSAVLKRTEIIDATELNKSGLTAEGLEEFIWGKAEQTGQVLAIVNTKKCAAKVYKGLVKRCKEEGFLLYHLSTNMCGTNRKEVLEELKQDLENEKKVICISTQIVEAGVDLSFHCVIRSLAGLDSIIQAAGRCNRHGKDGIGYVYLVRMCGAAENLNSLKDIRMAQECMAEFLQQYRMNPKRYGDSLSSDESIRLYYQLYMKKREGEMSYSSSANQGQVKLLELFSENKELWNGLPEEIRLKNRGLLLKQAFKTGGDLFEVITKDGKVDVIVEYNERAKEKISLLVSLHAGPEVRKEALRALQPYTVGISEQLRQKLGNAVTPICDGTVLILSENYYSKETGVSERPLGMGFMNF